MPGSVAPWRVRPRETDFREVIFWGCFFGIPLLFFFLSIIVSVLSHMGGGQPVLRKHGVGLFWGFYGVLGLRHKRVVFGWDIPSAYLGIVMDGSDVDMFFGFQLREQWGGQLDSWNHGSWTGRISTRASVMRLF
jgi:hypothetical protein